MRVRAVPEQRLYRFWCAYDQNPVREHECDRLADVASRSLQISVGRDYTTENVREVQKWIEAFYNSDHCRITEVECRELFNMLAVAFRG
jgi:hypothetical protein